MSEFKIGQTLRRFKGFNRGHGAGYIGVLSKIEPLSYDNKGPWLTFVDGHEGYATSFVVHEGPVRTVTRREIVPGVYGVLGVSVVRADAVRIGFAGHMGDGTYFWATAEELDSLAMIASQLAEALRDVD